MLFPLWSILVCKVPQFCQIYQFGQLIILFQEVNTLRLLKVAFMFCSQSGAKKNISSWTICDNYNTWDINLYFIHYLHVVIVLFSTSLYKSAFSTYSFEKLGFFLFFGFYVSMWTCSKRKGRIVNIPIVSYFFVIRIVSISY